MAKISEGLESALDIVLVSYKEEYARVANAWKDLETKAVGVTTVSGIFLGFVLNFIKDVHKEMTVLQQLLSGATLVSLLATLSLALATAVVRERVRAPESATLYKSATELHRLSDLAMVSDYAGRILQDQIRVWNAAVESRVAENTKKARFVKCAQLCLLLSMFLAATLAASALLS